MNTWVVCVGGFHPVGFDSKEKAYEYAVDMLFKHCYGNTWEEQRAKMALDESYAKNNGQFGFYIHSVNYSLTVYEVEVQ